MENFKILINSYKEYTFVLKGQVEIEVDTRLIEKKPMDIIEKCEFSHTKFEECLKEVQAYEEGEKTLFCISWSRWMPHMKYKMKWNQLNPK